MRAAATEATRLMAFGAGARDYGFCNARIRGMSARLLKPDFYDGLMSQPNLAAIVRMLEDTDYASDVEQALLGGRTAAGVDLGLRDAMARQFRGILGFVNDEAYRLGRALLGRWDVFNIKTVLRGRHVLAAPAEIVASVVPAATLTIADIEALAKAQDVRAVVDVLSMWRLPYARPLNRAMPEYVRTHDLSVLELALDRWFYEQVAERLRGGGPNHALVRRVLGAQIDVTNLVTVFRLQRAGVLGDDARRYHLVGGKRVDERLFIALIDAEGVEGVIDGLRQTPYAKPLDEAMLAYVETDSLAVFERALEEHLLRITLAEKSRDALGVGVLVSFLAAKQNEVTNLRIVVMGHAVGMPEDRMRGELILV